MGGRRERQRDRERARERERERERETRARAPRARARARPRRRPRRARAAPPRRAAARAAAAPLHVTTLPVTEAPITRRVAAAGTLQAVTTVEVGAQVSGIVQSLAADFNSFVHVGQVIARLDPSTYDAELHEAQAVLGQAQAALGRAKADALGLQTAREDAQTKLTRAEALAANELLTRSIWTRLVSPWTRRRPTWPRARPGWCRPRPPSIRRRPPSIRPPSTSNTPSSARPLTASSSTAASMSDRRSRPQYNRLCSSGSLRFHAHAEQVDIDESDVGGVTTGDVVTFEVESYPDETFSGILSQVRLQPVAAVSVTATTVPTSAVSAATSRDCRSRDLHRDCGGVESRPAAQTGHDGRARAPRSPAANAIRIPNSALSFRPPAEVWKALGTTGPSPPGPGSRELREPRNLSKSGGTDGNRFTPIRIERAWPTIAGRSFGAAPSGPATRL